MKLLSLVVKNEPSVAMQQKLWFAAQDTWLDYGLTPEEAHYARELPWELSRSLFSNVWSYGPNGDNVVRAATELKRILPGLNLKLDDLLWVDDYSVPLLELPRSVDDNFAGLADELSDALKLDEMVDEGVYAFLGLIALDGFVLGDESLWVRYKALFNQASSTFGFQSTEFRWVSPQGVKA